MIRTDVRHKSHGGVFDEDEISDGIVWRETFDAENMGVRERILFDNSDCGWYGSGAD